MQAGQASANIHQLCNSGGKALWNCLGVPSLSPSQQIDGAPYEKGLALE